MSETYSRIGIASLKKESSENVAVIPDVFFGFNEEDIAQEYPFVASMPISNNRSMNIRALKAAIPPAEGSITMNVEPKTFGHVLNGVFGGLTSGRYLPHSGGSGTFTVGETVTGGTSSATGTVLFVGNGFLLVTPSGTFQAAETITGGSSSATATVTAYSATVYGHAGVLPDNSMPSYTLQFNFADNAIRYFGVKFTGLDALAQDENIITAGVQIMAQSQFRHAKVTAVTNSGSGTKTLTVDQTFGLVATDVIKVWRPSTGAFLDFASSGVKTHAVATVASTTTITVTNLETSLAVGDLIMLAPQTASYSVVDEFTWIGGATAEMGDAVSSLSTTGVCLEDFTMVLANEYEPRHCAYGTLLKDRFAAHLLQKGVQVNGTFKAYYADEGRLRNMRTNTAQALRIKMVAGLISTGLYYEFWMTLPEVQFKPIQTNFSQDAIIDEEVEFDAFYNTTNAALAKCLLVNTITSY